MVRRLDLAADHLMAGGFDRFFLDRYGQRSRKGVGGLPTQRGQVIQRLFTAVLGIPAGQMPRFHQIAQGAGQFKVVDQSPMQQGIVDLGKGHTAVQLAQQVADQYLDFIAMGKTSGFHAGGKSIQIQTGHFLSSKTKYLLLYIKKQKKKAPQRALSFFFVRSVRFFAVIDRKTPPTAAS